MSKTIGGNKLPDTNTNMFGKPGMKKETSNIKSNSLPVRFNAKPEPKSKKYP